MADGKQTTIGVSRERYALLTEKKRALEEAVGQRFSWGTFLLILAGLHPVDKFASKEQNKFVKMRSDDGETNPEDGKKIPGWVDKKKEVKRIARAEGNRVIRSLKEVNVSKQLPTNANSPAAVKGYW